MLDNYYMASKQAVMGHKTLVYSRVGFPLEGILEKLQNALKASIPEGYQDESGFHLGVKRAEREANWPTTW